MRSYLEIIAIAVGIMLFIWSSAVVATGFALGIGKGRYGKRECYKFIAAMIILLLCVIAYAQIETDVPLPPPDAAPP